MFFRTEKKIFILRKRQKKDGRDYFPKEMKIWPIINTQSKTTPVKRNQRDGARKDLLKKQWRKKKKKETRVHELKEQVGKEHTYSQREERGRRGGKNATADACGSGYQRI